MTRRLLFGKTPECFPVKLVDLHGSLEIRLFPSVELVIKADMPGVKKEDLHLDLARNVLKLSGEKKMEKTVEKGGFYRSERNYGRFSRRLELPSDVDTEKITASLKEGVLEIRLPKTEKAETEARKISIK